MSFVVYDLIFLALFTIATVMFLYRRRKNLKRQGILYLYRTQIGVKIMDSFSEKYRKILVPAQYLIIASGYALMVAMLWLLAKVTYTYSTSSLFIRETKIPPIIPLVPYLPEIFKVDFLPPFYFTYWIVIIAIVAISHEFAHGIFARLNNIKVKSTGFGFLGPFLAAFVEPDEKSMAKTSKFVQLSILAAGTFANILMTLFFGIILLIFFSLSFSAAGVNFNSYGSALINTTDIDSVAGQGILSFEQIADLELNDSLVDIRANNRTYFVSGAGLKNAAGQDAIAIVAYEDSPALRAGLKSPILEIDGVKVTDSETLRNEIRRHSPGETINIVTMQDDERINYDIELADREGNAYLGIGIINPERRGLSGLYYSFIIKFKDPFVYYEPNWDGDFAWFIYHLLWWTVLINFSVALVNMLPVGIFDGGRFFYLTIWGLTGKENLARKSFSFATWLILLVFVWMTLRWFLVYF